MKARCLWFPTAGIVTYSPDQEVVLRVYKNPEKDRPDSGDIVTTVKVVSQCLH